MDVLAHVLEVVRVLLMQFIVAQGVIQYVQQHVKQDVRNLVKMVVKQDVILHAKTTVHLVVKEVVRQDVQVIVRMVVKAHVKEVVEVLVALIVMVHALQLVWDADILAWDVVELCSFDYGERSKRFLAGRIGKNRHFYRDKRLSIGLQVLLFSWQEFQGTNVLGCRKTSYRLCA